MIEASLQGGAQICGHSGYLRLDPRIKCIYPAQPELDSSPAGQSRFFQVAEGRRATPSLWPAGLREPGGQDCERARRGPARRGSARRSGSSVLLQSGWSLWFWGEGRECEGSGERRLLKPFIFESSYIQPLFNLLDPGSLGHVLILPSSETMK